ncbi:hypothetical protein [Streptomyces sp. NRRL WC-3725]|uniref:hypothetical protein n=1 Tax=Streptomyces sp. NRRL WC-3725 TaxID=1463933 RepID=UPI0006922594|nr:hypothetical protein [Streptomyces sp. NRRL WC-3725]
MSGVRTDGRGERARERAGRDRSARGPWAVVRAVATVLLGPAAVTASALDQANAAPMHQPAEADRTRAHPPADPTRRRTAAQHRPHPRNRRHRRGYR